MSDVTNRQPRSDLPIVLLTGSLGVAGIVAIGLLLKACGLEATGEDACRATQLFHMTHCEVRETRWTDWGTCGKNASRFDLHAIDRDGHGVDLVACCPYGLPCSVRLR